MDIDLFGKTSNQVTEIVNMISEVCSITVGPHGLVFDLTNIQSAPTIEGAAYEGIRVRLSCKLGTAVARVKIDI